METIFSQILVLAAFIAGYFLANQEIKEKVIKKLKIFPIKKGRIFQSYDLEKDKQKKAQETEAENQLPHPIE